METNVDQSAEELRMSGHWVYRVGNMNLDAADRRVLLCMWWGAG